MEISIDKYNGEGVKRKGSINKKTSYCRNLSLTWCVKEGGGKKRNKNIKNLVFNLSEVGEKWTPRKITIELITI
ncbi:hypothetical protein FG379_003097 [Cryptosporidium bovis]|uniref:uncharacterized protein n=1 Tax=Cryptosporidium bovis TaxID=310047 RepID=UPI00351A554B|nr:hypothetical protein FG379_003097 [Cryptosporidium bovis]